jgi:crotonobetainyl-CoA:carnitine CoA-transferase CaiB-like acyl-CoA transferase
VQAILEGVRVLDFGRYIAGPFCSALLADFGADVIRIEKRGGSEDRFLLPITPSGDGASYIALNRNKRSLTLDPASDRGREIVRRLVATADVVVVNLPVPRLAALGLDYESLRAIRPDIILTMVSAFGSQGPYRDRVGFDAVGQAMSGSAFISGLPDAPARSMTNFVDYSTALASAYGTALALLERARTGEGRVVEASLFRTALNLTNGYALEQAATGRNRVGTGNRAQSAAPADLYRTSDGWIVIQVVGDPLFRRLARVVESPQWLEDPRFADDTRRGDHAAEIGERVAAWCAPRSNREALAELEGARIPCGPVYSFAEVLDDPHVRAAGLYEDIPYPGLPEPAKVAAAPVTLSGRPAATRRAPLVGEHTSAILSELGYSESDIAALAACGAI